MFGVVPALTYLSLSSSMMPTRGGVSNTFCVGNNVPFSFLRDEEAPYSL